MWIDPGSAVVQLLGKHDQDAAGAADVGEHVHVCIQRQSPFANAGTLPATLDQSRDRGLAGSTQCGYCEHGLTSWRRVTIATTLTHRRTRVRKWTLSSHMHAVAYQAANKAGEQFADG